MPPLIVAGLGTVGITGGLATVGANLIFSGAMVGLSLLFAPDVPKPEAARVPLKQPIPPRQGVMGTTRVSGPYMLFIWDGQSLDINALADGESSEFVRLYLNDDVVELSDGERVIRLSDGRYGHSTVHLYFRYGANPETAIDDFVVGSAGIWTVDHRGDGITYVGMLIDNIARKDLPEKFPQGLPVFSAAINSRKVFDPRDVDQDGTDPSTWSFANNDNPILMAVTYSITPIYKGGLGLDFTECFLPVVDDIAAQADICDEAVNLKAGGTQPRYRAGGHWLYSDPPGDVLAAILGACDGFMCERGDGAFTIRAGKYDEGDADLTITDKHIISLRVKRFKDDEDDVTGVIVKYNSPPHEYTTVDAPVWPPESYPGGGSDRRIRSVEIVWCQNGQQAQRLAKRVGIYEMANVTGTMVTTLYGITVMDRRFCHIQCSDDPDLEDSVIKINRVEPDLMAGTVTIDFTVLDPTVLDAWDETTEEMPLQPSVTQPLEGEPVTPTDVTAVAEQVSGTVYVVLVFPRADKPDGEGYNVRYRLSDIGGGIPGAWGAIQEFGNDTLLYTGGDVLLTINDVGLAEFDFQVQSDGSNGASAWSVSATVNTIDAVAPGRPQGFTATLAGADVNLAWTAPNSSNFDHANVYRALTGSLFGSATDISGDIAGSPVDAMTYTDVAPASDIYDYWVVAKTAAGVASTPAGPRTVTVP